MTPINKSQRKPGKRRLKGRAGREQSSKKRQRDADARKPELLAPAGSIDAFFAALEQGADAVYVGTQEFNARIRAQNFSLDDLARMIAYARTIDRKVYVTLNTLIREQELAAVAETLDALRRIGPDALIIQDLGVYRLARRLAPEIPLHASTQMTVHNLEGALQAQRMGFERVILARELTIEEIRDIRGQAEIELETFVHGALCYSISGQCLLSSHLHGKSANRGRCLQPCRRLYEIDGKREPAFSPLDLGAAPILAQLISSGVKCFKIEGRLKPAEAIAQTVAAYRMMIDAYPKIDRNTIAESRRRLGLALGRRPSTGFYQSASGKDALTGEGATRAGRFLGRSLEAGPNRFGLITREVVKVGDRLRLKVASHEAPRNLTVERMFVGKRKIDQSRPGQEIAIETSFPTPKGTPVTKIIDADAITAEAKAHDEKKWPHAMERAKAQLATRVVSGASGDIGLSVTAGNESVKVNAPGGMDGTPLSEAKELLGAASERFPVRLAPTIEGLDGGDFPMAAYEIEALRERTLHQLTRRIDRQRDEVLTALAEPLSMKSDRPIEFERFIKVNRLEEARPASQGGHFGVIAPLHEIARRDAKTLLEQLKSTDGLFLELPTFVFDQARREDVERALATAAKMGLRQFVVSNLGHFHLLRDAPKKGMRVIAGPALGLLNSESLAQLRELRVDLALYSLEGDGGNLERLVARVGADGVIVEVFGAVPLFQSRFSGPRSKDEEIALVEPAERLHTSTDDGITRVFSERVLSLRHLMPQMREIGLRRFLYDFTHGAGKAKRTAAIVRPTPRHDPRKEMTMNFERGLE